MNLIFQSCEIQKVYLKCECFDSSDQQRLWQGDCNPGKWIWSSHSSIFVGHLLNQSIDREWGGVDILSKKKWLLVIKFYIFFNFFVKGKTASGIQRFIVIQFHRPHLPNTTLGRPLMLKCSYCDQKCLVTEWSH